MSKINSEDKNQLHSLICRLIRSNNFWKYFAYVIYLSPAAFLPAEKLEEYDFRFNQSTVVYYLFCLMVLIIFFAVLHIYKPPSIVPENNKETFLFFGRLNSYYLHFLVNMLFLPLLLIVQFSKNYSDVNSLYCFLILLFCTLIFVYHKILINKFITNYVDSRKI